MKTFDAYVRVSRVGGREGESYGSPAEQEARCREWIERNGKLGLLITEEDVSGGKAAKDRELGKLIERCELGQSAGIVVYDFSRFSREHPYHAMDSLRRLEDSGAKLIGVIDGFDSSSKMGQMVAGMMAGMASGYRDKVSEQWAASKRRAVERGVFPGKTPFGYSRHADGRLIPNADAAKVRKVFEGRLQGLSYTDLAKLAGGTKGLIQRMLANRVYLGEVRSGSYFKADAHEPIISGETFDRVQGRKTKRQGQLDGNASKSALLKGLARCASCGKALIYTKTSTSPIYYCRGDSSNGCEARASITVEALDSFVRDELFRHFMDSTGPFADAALAANRLAEAQAVVDEKQAGLSNVLGLAGVLDADEFTTAVENAKGGLELAKIQLAETTAQASTQADVKTWTKLLTLPKDEQRELIASLVEEVRIFPAHGKRNIPTAQRVMVLGRGNVALVAPETVAPYEIRNGSLV